MAHRSYAAWFLSLGLLAQPLSQARAQEATNDMEAPTAAPSAPAEEAAETSASVPKGGREQATLRQLEGELSSVLDELIQARTRASVLTKTLFRTPISVHLTRRANAQRLSHITLRLDGVPVHDSDGAALIAAGDDAVVFEGFAAPGMHELTLEITEQAVENAAYHYTRSERFRIEVKKDTKTHVALFVKDASDMAQKLPRKNKGTYDVRTQLRVRAEKVAKD